MSDPKYVEFSTPEDKVIEECSELIQAICKAKAFGHYSSHPNRPERTNLRDIADEISDVENALARYKYYLSTATLK